MDRNLLYPGALPLTTDVMGPEKFTMYALARLSEALFGAGTAISGLACTPTGPASLNVNVGPGSIYFQTQADATPYGDLGTDSTLLVKQGIINAITPFLITPPGTPGQSQNYLIQAQFAETDGVPVTLLYINTSNPPNSYAQPWSGPNNSGNANNTVRADTCVLSIKAGVPATTGTQVTPVPDANNVGVWVITIAQGQTTITAPNISAYPTAPFITPITQTSAINAFREPLQVVSPYGAPPAVTGQIADTLVMVFGKANTPGVFFNFPVTTRIDPTKPMRLGIEYTTDLNGGSAFIALSYQVVSTGGFTPAAYTQVTEAIPAPATAGNKMYVQTTTAIIPAVAMISNAMINCVLQRLGPNGSDTNLGNLQIVQITLEQ